MVRALARHPCPTHASVRSLYEAAPRLLMRSGAKSRTGLGAFPSVVALDSQVRGFGSVAILSEEWFCDILSPAADERKTACFTVFPVAVEFERVYNTTYGRSLPSARLGVIRGGASTHD